MGSVGAHKGQRSWQGLRTSRQQLGSNETDRIKVRYKAGRAWVGLNEESQVAGLAAWFSAKVAEAGGFCTCDLFLSQWGKAKNLELT